MRAWFVASVLTAGVFAWSAPHPLDDLTAEEIGRTVAALKASQKFSADARYPILALDEPDKTAVLDGKPRLRRARVTVLETTKGRYWEAVVDPLAAKVVSLVEKKGSQPPILLEEYDQNAALVRKDPRWIEAIKKRGVSVDDVAIDSWVPGLLTPAEKRRGGRLMRAVSYFKGKSENYYARPIEGLIATVDVGKKAVIEVLDTGVVPVAKGVQEMTEAANGPIRQSLKPYQVARPKGMSFQVENGEVKWEHWRFRFSLHPQKGLTLYQVGYEDSGRVRPVAYKVGLSEMVVPYGDPDKTWTFRNAFDLGEYGVGRTAHSLTAELDAPEGGVFFDATFADDAGGVFKIPQAIALFERETGVLWKHVDQNTRKGEGRRNRELVLTFMTTVGNYDYGVKYLFGLDGTLEVAVELTGMLQAKGTTLTQNPCAEGCSHLVEPNVIGPTHQHFFAFRVDLDVDGKTNTPVEMNVKPLTGALNPSHNAFDSFQTILKREKSAARDLSLAESRKWKVMNPTVKNALGHPTGYALIPGENSVPYLGKQSPVRKRAGFVEHPVWFTRYRGEEQGAAGDYPNQHPTGDGLPRFIADDQPLENQDVVLWYTFGITHVPRPEEWPIMNMHRAGFKLIPLNFFSRNPAMNVPAPQPVGTAR